MPMAREGRVERKEQIKGEEWVQDVLTIVRGVECDEKLSLMRVGVQFGNEIGMALEILLDTGAQTNLIRTHVVPDRYLRESKTPLGLKTVSGASLCGGTKEVTAMLKFQGHSERGREEPNWTEEAVFYEAEIHCDAILGFPWMRSHGMGILPVDALDDQAVKVWNPLGVGSLEGKG